MRLYNLKEPSKGDTGIDTDNFVKMVRLLRALQNIQIDARYFDTRMDQTGMFVTMREAPGDVIDESKIAFGMSLSGATVTIYGGEIQVGALIPQVTADIDTRVINADLQYLSVEYNLQSHTISLGAPTTDKPITTGTIFKKWLGLFNFDGTTASWNRRGWNGGNIHLPGNFGG